MSRTAARHKCKPAKSWAGEYVYKYGRIDTPERLGWLQQILLEHQLYKTTQWRREEELRIVGRRSADSGTIAFNPLLLTRIVLGKKMTGEHQLLIREWAEKRVPSLRVESASDMVLV